jgi:hypothetical protein
MRRLLVVGAVAGVAVGVGQIVSHRARRGDGSSDDLRRAAVLGGCDLHIRSTALRRVELLVGLGGVNLDLTGARLDPEGATVQIRGLLGGVNVVVPDDWRVTSSSRGPGGVELDTTPADDLPSSAPHLHLESTLALAGVAVEGVASPAQVLDLRSRAATASTAD